MKANSCPPKQINTAIIGCGKVGKTHADAFKSIRESKFAAVYDQQPDRAEDYAIRYGVKAYDNLDKMFNDQDVQMCSICTPHPFHPELVVACAKANVHVLVEKPLAVDLKGCDKSISAAEKAGIKLGVVSQRRFYEPVMRVKNAIVSGKIGKPILGTLELMGWRDEAYYRSDPWRGKWNTEGGGVLVNQASHHLDLLQWFMGPLEELYGYWGNLNHPYIEVEDTAIAVVRFANSALGTILVSNSQKPGFYGKLHVHGENGASVGVQTDDGSPFIAGVTEKVEPAINDIWTVPGEENLLEQWQIEDKARSEKLDTMSHYHKLQIRDFLRAILDDREPAVGGREGRKHVEVFTAIYRSQRDRRPIQFPLDASKGSDLFDGRLV